MVAAAAAGAPVVEPLIHLLSAEKGRLPAVRHAAIRALGQIGDARAVEPLIALLHEHDPLLRVEVAEALGQLRDARAVEPLLFMLSGGYAECAAAAKALGVMGDPRAIPPLLDLLYDSDEAMRRAAARAAPHDKRRPARIRDASAAGAGRGNEDLRVTFNPTRAQIRVKGKCEARCR
jgi:HEAT repeat protein